MKIHTCLVIIAATSLGACAAAPPKPAAPPPPEKTVEVAPVSKAVPTMPAVYTQKGVTVTVESLWQSPAGEILGVTGTAKNATASNLKFCQVSLAFLGQDGNQAGRGEGVDQEPEVRTSVALPGRLVACGRGVVFVDNVRQDHRDSREGTETRSCQPEVAATVRSPGIPGAAITRTATSSPRPLAHCAAAFFANSA